MPLVPTCSHGYSVSAFATARYFLGQRVSWRILYPETPTRVCPRPLGLIVDGKTQRKNRFALSWPPLLWMLTHPTASLEKSGCVVGHDANPQGRLTGS